MKFGEHLKQLRIKKALTLRQCCMELHYDPSNWSKIERCVNPAPKDVNVLKHWATFFGLRGQTEAEFFDLAVLSRNEIPQDIAEDEQILSALPAFFRAARGKELKGQKLDEFIEKIRSLHSPDENA